MSTAVTVPETQPAPPRTLTRPPGIVLQALWFGLLTGLLEYSVRAVKLYGFHRFIFAANNPHNAWMTIVANIVIFAGFGAVLAGVARMRPRWVSARLSVFFFTALAYFSIGDIVLVNKWYASLLLAIGIAAASSRLAARNQEGFLRLVKRSLPVVAAAAALVSIGMFARVVFRESRAVAALPKAPERAPNVLLLVLDTVRAQDLSLYGYSRETSPRLSQLAARGACFDRAISTVSWTLPSHASMFTGRYPYELFRDFDKMKNIDWQAPLGPEYPTLAEYLAGRGYLTAGFVANWVYCDRVYGLDRGFLHYEDYQVSVEQTAKSAFLGLAFTRALYAAINPQHVPARKDAAEVNREFLGWLDHNPDRPFFAFLNYMDAHGPFVPPVGFADRFVGEKLPEPTTVPDFVPTGPGALELMESRRRYDAGIAYLDMKVGQLLDELERRRLLDNTILIVTADHGEHFGEHGKTGHGYTLYMPVLRVPLIICFQGKVPAGQRIPQVISLRDLPATVCDLLDIDQGRAFPGESLARWWRPHSGANTEAAFSNFDNHVANRNKYTAVHLRSLIDERCHYLLNAENGAEELYDLVGDPNETTNLGNTEQRRKLLPIYRADPRIRAADPRASFDR
jgi:arylsulfatase A-like enzyme